MKNVPISFRVTKEMEEMIKQKCKEKAINKTTYFRSLLIKDLSR